VNGNKGGWLKMPQNIVPCQAVLCVTEHYQTSSIVKLKNVQNAWLWKNRHANNVLLDVKSQFVLHELCK
jgi:hypothetical protein